MIDANAEAAPVLVTNPNGASPFVLLCDHASRSIPSAYSDMGLTDAERSSHIAWDPGALAVAERISEAFDAPLVHSTVSRLIIDCNRSLDASNLFWTLSENTRIAVNENLDPAERQHRIDSYYRPYHAAISDLLDARQAAGRETILVCMHSFTPVYRDIPRLMAAGIIHGSDTAYSQAVFDALVVAAPDNHVGWNEPYSARDGVTFTLNHHGDARGLHATMIEVRNDEIGNAKGQAEWARRLQDALEQARARMPRADDEGKR